MANSSSYKSESVKFKEFQGNISENSRNKEPKWRRCKSVESDIELFKLEL